MHVTSHADANEPVPAAKIAGDAAQRGHFHMPDIFLRIDKSTQSSTGRVRLSICSFLLVPLILCAFTLDAFSTPNS